MGLDSLLPGLYADPDPAHLVWVRAVIEATVRYKEQEAERLAADG